MVRMKVMGDRDDLLEKGYGLNSVDCQSGEYWVVLPGNDTKVIEKAVKQHKLTVLSGAEVL